MSATDRAQPVRTVRVIGAAVPGLLSAFFAWAVRERMIATTPVTGTRVPKGRGVRTEIRPFTEDELESFHLAVTARNQRLADVLLVAGWTACAGRSCARCGSATSSRCRCR